MTSRPRRRLCRQSSEVESVAWESDAIWCPEVPSAKIFVGVPVLLQASASRFPAESPRDVAITAEATPVTPLSKALAELERGMPSSRNPSSMTSYSILRCLGMHVCILPVLVHILSTITSSGSDPSLARFAGLRHPCYIF